MLSLLNPNLKESISWKFGKTTIEPIMNDPLEFKLKYISFSELFNTKGLLKLDHIFLEFLKSTNSELYNLLIEYRNGSNNLPSPKLSEFLIELAVVLENFLVDLFDIEHEAALAQAQTILNNPISAFKKFFVLRKAKKNVSQANTYPSFNELNNWLNSELSKSPLQTSDKELAVALLATQYLNEPERFSLEIEKLTQWCVQALVSEQGKKLTENWTSFHIPERLDFSNLVPTISENKDLNRQTVPENQLKLRDGFKLTDSGMNAREVQDEVNYCIYCHDNEGDFCSKGFPVKKTEPQLGFKKNPLDVTLTGCPLEEKISEMNFLKRDGYTLASLAMVMVDNPMCPATGHRICNDCMKSCIYQKQEPVNVPQIETRVLLDVLHLPWGVEIYDLLTRWNPLRQKQWIMKPYNGLKILIAGMGPAGFTLAHHLLQEGFAVVGFDGLKIEPLPSELINQPIYSYENLKESLDERLLAGFGGVAEYGITVRWDKNFLKLIYLSLMRRPYFQVFGSTRFGGTITVEDAWTLGFDHFVIAVGAGLPKALPIPGSLAPGMRQANDFLMALQLGNAAKSSSLTNLQIRLPAVVIGGGLTGVDTATEVQAYYIRQVEKTAERFEKLIEVYGEKNIRENLDAHSLEVLDEYIMHANAIREERKRAELSNEKPNFIKLIRAWGGVTIVYRRIMQESPAYINNHEELKKALDEGIYYLSGLEPESAELDEFGYVQTLICRRKVEQDNKEWQSTSELMSIPARSIFVATGTQPNIAYEFEHRGTFNRIGINYQHYEEDENDELRVAHGVTNCKEKNFGPFTSYQKDDYRVSLIGDTHPVFHGSVVKAMASGLRAYPKILDALKDKLRNDTDINEYQIFANYMTELFDAKVIAIKRYTENVIELRIKAPIAAKHFKPGHFYRLQNYETHAPKIEDTLLQMEPLALIALGHDAKAGWLDFMVIENGTSSKICSILKVGEKVSLMGPTGVRSKISHEHETVMIVGNQMSIPLLLSYGLALRQAGNRVIYLGMFNDASEVYCQERLENACDLIVWNMPSSTNFKKRDQDYIVAHSFKYGHLTGADNKNYFQNLLKNYFDYKNPQIALQDIDRIYVIGDTNLLRQFQMEREKLVKEIFIKEPKIFGSVHSTMQCMLKGVCAQCLQWQIDPETGKRTKAVFACSWPNQPIELIDFDNLEERQVQNRLQEKLSSLWLDYLFSKNVIDRV